MIMNYKVMSTNGALLLLV